LLAVFSIRRQLASLKRIRTGTLPSDDRGYLRSQAYRRLVQGLLLIVLAAMLAGTFLSGMEQRADEPRRKVIAGDDKPPPTQEEKEFMRFYLIYWSAILLLLFVVVSMAIVDMWSTRRYAWQQFRRIQSENRTMLERDLAMYRQQKINDRMRH
jgi:hypothetical protein